eukprot:1806296-Rhodomonas_salina.3
MCGSDCAISYAVIGTEVQFWARAGAAQSCGRALARMLPYLLVYVLRVPPRLTPTIPPTLPPTLPPSTFLRTIARHSRISDAYLVCPTRFYYAYLIEYPCPYLLPVSCAHILRVPPPSISYAVLGTEGLRMVLHAVYRETEVLSTVLRPRYAMSGTDVGRAATNVLHAGRYCDKGHA